MRLLNLRRCEKNKKLGGLAPLAFWFGLGFVWFVRSVSSVFSLLCLWLSVCFGCLFWFFCGLVWPFLCGLRALLGACLASAGFWFWGWVLVSARVWVWALATQVRL